MHPGHPLRPYHGLSVELEVAAALEAGNHPWACPCQCWVCQQCQCLLGPASLHQKVLSTLHEDLGGIRLRSARSWFCFGWAMVLALHVRRRQGHRGERPSVSAQPRTLGVINSTLLIVLTGSPGCRGLSQACAWARHCRIPRALSPDLKSAGPHDRPNQAGQVPSITHGCQSLSKPFFNVFLIIRHIPLTGLTF